MDEITPVLEHKHPTGSGVQKVYRFDNGYGASVVRFMVGPFGGSYGAEQGLWELAVLKFDGEDNENFEICYDTPITNDVIGRITEDEAQEILKEIKELPHG
jgi:hypothetical protein